MQQERIRLAAKIIALVSARIQNLRETKPDLSLRFRLRGNEHQNEVVDSFILRVDWDEKGRKNKKIYLCLVPKTYYHKTQELNDRDINISLQIALSIYQEFRNTLSASHQLNLHDTFDGVDQNNDYCVVLYWTNGIALEQQSRDPPNNSPIIGTFQTRSNGVVCFRDANDQIVQKVLSGSNFSILNDFVSNLLLVDARIEESDLGKLVKNALQTYLWDKRKWPYANNVVKEYLKYIEELWGSRNILSHDSMKLHEIVRNYINNQHSVIECDYSVLDVTQQLQNQELSYVVVGDIPPNVRCSRVIQALRRTSDKFLIVTQEKLKEWDKSILKNIYENQELCTQLVLSVIYIDSELQSFLKSIRGLSCHITVVSPSWEIETHEFLQSFCSSYTAWSERRIERMFYQLEAWKIVEETT